MRHNYDEVYERVLQKKPIVDCTPRSKFIALALYYILYAGYSVKEAMGEASKILNYKYTPQDKHAISYLSYKMKEMLDRDIRKEITKDIAKFLKKHQSFYDWLYEYNIPMATMFALLKGNYLHKHSKTSAWKNYLRFWRDIKTGEVRKKRRKSSKPSIPVKQMLCDIMRGLSMVAVAQKYNLNWNYVVYARRDIIRNILDFYNKRVLPSLQKEDKEKLEEVGINPHALFPHVRLTSKVLWQVGYYLNEIAPEDASTELLQHLQKCWKRGNK